MQDTCSMEHVQGKRGRPRKTEEEKAAVRKAKFERYRLAGFYKVGAKYNPRPLKGKRKDDVYLDPYHTYFREYMREYRKKGKRDQ